MVQTELLGGVKGVSSIRCGGLDECSILSIERGRSNDKAGYALIDEDMCRRKQGAIGSFECQGAMLKLVPKSEISPSHVPK